MHESELDQFKRHINLVEFAVDRYGYRRLPRESSRSCHVLDHAPTKDRILVTRQADGHWVYCSVRDDRDNGSVVDFVQRRRRFDLGRTRQELRDWLRLPRSDPGPEHRPACPPVVRNRRAVVEAFAAARSLRNSAYLNSRGLRSETLTSPRFRGTWKVDARGNVLFPHRDEEGLAGFEIKNRGFTGFARGGSKALWQSARRPSDTILLITESAIDAISYQQLHRTEHVGYLSVAGTISREQAELLGRTFAALPPSVEIVAGVDSDLAGRVLAGILTQIAAAHGRAIVQHSPDPGVAKDWNDVLQRFERQRGPSRDRLAPLPGPEHLR
jgi:hypothetical protein